MKKSLSWAAGIVGLLVALVLAAIILPFLIDLNRFKPLIQKAVSNAVRADLDFESARLTLFPKLGIKVTNLKVTNTDPVFRGTQLFSTDGLLIQTEFWPLLEKKVVGEIQVDGPEIVFSNKRIENNFGALAKPDSNAGGGSSETPPTPADSGAGGQDSKAGDPGNAGRESTGGAAAPAENLKMIRENLVIKSINITRAKLTHRVWKDTAFQESSRIEGLDLLVSNIGLERDVKVDISSLVDSKEQGNTLKGKVTLSNVVNVALQEQAGKLGLKSARFSADLSFKDLAIEAAGGMFSKASGVPLAVQLQGVHSQTGTEISALDFVLSNLKLQASGRLSADAKKQADLKWSFESPDLSALGEVLPKHKKFFSKSDLSFVGSLKGPLAEWEALSTEAQLKLNLTGTDLDLKWDLKKVLPVQGQIDFVSKRLAVAELMAAAGVGAGAGSESGKPASAESGGSETSSVEGQKATAEAKQGLGSNPSASEEAANPASVPKQDVKKDAKVDSKVEAKDFELTEDQRKQLQGMDLVFRGQIGELVYGEFPFKKMNINAALVGLRLKLSQFGAEGFGGKLQVGADADLGAKPLSFIADLALQDVSSSAVVALFSPQNKDVLKSKLGLNLKAQGKGTTLHTLSKTLNAKGTYNLKDAELNTESLVSLTHAKIEEKLKNTSAVKAAEDVFGAAEKILQNPLLKSIPNANIAEKVNISKYKEEYEKIRSLKFLDKAQVDKKIKDSTGALEIVNGRIKITSNNSGRDGQIQFQGSVGIDSTLEGKALFTSSGELQTRLEKQSKYVSFLYNKDKQISVPLLVSGTVQKPLVTPDFRELESTLSANARNYAETEIRKKAEEEVKKLLKSGVDEAAKNAQERLKKEGKKLEEKAKKELEKAAGKDGEKALRGLFGK